MKKLPDLFGSFFICLSEAIDHMSLANSAQFCFPSEKNNPLKILLRSKIKRGLFFPDGKKDYFAGFFSLKAMRKLRSLWIRSVLLSFSASSYSSIMCQILPRQV